MVGVFTPWVLAKHHYKSDSFFPEELVVYHLPAHFCLDLRLPALPVPVVLPIGRIQSEPKGKGTGDAVFAGWIRGTEQGGDGWRRTGSRAYGREVTSASPRVVPTVL